MHGVQSPAGADGEKGAYAVWQRILDEAERSQPCLLKTGTFILPNMIPMGSPLFSFGISYRIGTKITGLLGCDMYSQLNDYLAHRRISSRLPLPTSSLHCGNVLSIMLNSLLFPGGNVVIEDPINFFT